MNLKIVNIFLLVSLAGSVCGVTTWKGAESGYWDMHSNWAGSFPVSNSTVRLNHENQSNAYTVIIQASAETDKLWIDTYGEIPVHLHINETGSLRLNSMRMGFKEADRESSITIDGGSMWGLNPVDPAITNTAFLVGNNPDCLAMLRIQNNGLLSVQGSNGLIVASSKESMGLLSVTNGNLQIRDSLLLGKGPGSSGELMISGSSSVSITGALHIAKLDNGALMPTGMVVMAEGRLECGTLNVGAYGIGTFTQTGGDSSVGSGGITIGLSNADGRLNMQGGTLRATNSFMNVGHTDSTGLLVMSNGTIQIDGAIGIGSGSRSYGQIDLSGGSISANQLILGEALSASSMLNLQGGELLIQGSTAADLQIINGSIHLQQTLIRWANPGVTEWVTHAVDAGTLSFTNGLLPGTYSTNGYDGRLIRGDAALYWDNLENGSQFGQSAIWVEQLHVATALYETWAADYNLTESALTADPDADGRDNLAEYGLGANPTNANDAAVLPTIGTFDDYGIPSIEYVYRRRTDSAARGLDYYLEQSTNLVAGTWRDEVGSVIGIGPNEDGFEFVTNRIPATLDPVLYIRLRIQMD